MPKRYRQSSKSTKSGKPGKLYVNSKAHSPGVKAYLDRLQSFGPDKVLSERIDALASEKKQRPA